AKQPPGEMAEPRGCVQRPLVSCQNIRGSHASSRGARDRASAREIPAKAVVDPASNRQSVGNWALTAEPHLCDTAPTCASLRPSPADIGRSERSLVAGAQVGLALIPG